MINKTEKEIMQNWKEDILNPIVSICCITYNHEKYIEETIDSFLNQQTDYPFEVIIGEDCSTDQTRKKIEAYVEKFPNIIKLITSENNVGMNRNFGRIFSASKGEYIAICEGDDYWIDSKKLQIQIEEMKKHSDVDISFHPVYQLKNEKITKKLCNHSSKNKVFTTEEVILGDGGFMPTNSLIIKKEVLHNLPKWFYEYAPIGDYYIQMFGSRKSGALYINKLMGIYRVSHSNSWTDKMKTSEKIKEYRIKTDICYNNLFNEFDEMYHDIIKKIITKSNLATLSKAQLSMEYKKSLYYEKKDIFSLKEKLLWKFIFSKPLLSKISLYFYNLFKYITK